MPAPRLDDANIEFTFSEEEGRAARILDPLKIMWFQTKYAAYWKMRNSIPVSESSDVDRSYFVKIAELDGRLGAIQEILDDHKNALKEFNEAKQVTQAGAEVKDQKMESIAHRAGELVHGS